jgi:hypothetical protein
VKNNLFKAYALIVGQLMSLILTAYMVGYHLYTYNIVLNAAKVHLWLQFLLTIFLSYSLYHFVRVTKISSKMRKAAREQKESNSKRIELLIYALTLSIVFASIFYTAPFRKYYPSSIEYGVYFYNTILQLLLLISLMGTDNHLSKDFIKKKQTHAGAGAASAVLLFYIYFQLM